MELVHAQHATAFARVGGAIRSIALIIGLVLHLQHEMPHRTTIWRWKKKGRPRSGRGRRLRTKPDNLIRARLITLLAQSEMIEEAAASEFVDSAPSDPIDLVAVVLNDFFHLGLRTRTPNFAQLTRRLQAAYPKLTKEQCEQFAASGKPWLAEFTKHTEPNMSLNGARLFREMFSDNDDSDLPAMQTFSHRERQCCSISRLFPSISRRMEWYWRRDPRYMRIARRLRRIHDRQHKVHADRPLTVTEAIEEVRGSGFADFDNLAPLRQRLEAET